MQSSIISKGTLLGVVLVVCRGNSRRILIERERERERESERERAKTINTKTLINKLYIFANIDEFRLRFGYFV